MKIKYLAIYVSDIEASRVFYEALGSKCQKEQHGTGSIHYSMNLDGIVIELYPRGQRETSQVRLGISTPKGLSEIGTQLIRSISGSGKNTIIAVDPDGNAVEISKQE